MSVWKGLGFGLAALLAGASPAPAQEAAEEGASYVFEDQTFYPGAAWMPDALIYVLGRDHASRGEPRRFAFPPEGEAEACAALCEGDAACSGWLYEGRGRLAAAACHVFDYGMDFGYETRTPGEGVVSGLKPDAVRLDRPWPPEEGEWAEGGEDWEDWDGDVNYVEILLSPPPGYEDRPVVWSAAPLGEQALEAMAMPYPALGDFETALDPGRWAVYGEGAGFDLRGEIEIAQEGGERRFVIPLDPAPWDPTKTAFVCEGEEVCEYEDALTGLRFHLPADWSASAPYFYETAGGVRAERPTVTFDHVRKAGAEAVSLNLRQAGQGARCVETGAGRLCLQDLESGEAAEAFGVLQASLEMGPVWLGPEHEE